MNSSAALTPASACSHGDHSTRRSGTFGVRESCELWDGCVLRAVIATPQDVALGQYWHYESP